MDNGIEIEESIMWIMYQNLYQDDVIIVNMIINYPFIEEFMKQGLVDHVITEM
jgi:hypothetical protein